MAYAKEKAAENEVRIAHVLLGNATSLPELPRVEYDALLLMGPLYHLLALEERRQALSEAKNVLRFNGPIFASFVTRFAVIRNFAINDPQWVHDHPSRFAEMMKTGAHPSGPDKHYPDFHFAHPREIRPLMETAGFKTMNLIGCEGVVAGHEEIINKVEGELWETWVELNYRFGQEPSLHGAADHLLYVGRKI